MSFKDKTSKQNYGSIIIKSRYRTGTLLEAKGWTGNILG
jgi:hypothetical protein